MPDLAIAGSLSTALNALRVLLANVPYFQTWTGSSDATEALRHIVIGAMGFNIKSFQIASNVVTVNTVEPHNLSVGGLVIVEGLGDVLDGEYTVASVPTTKQFTFAKTADDVDLDEVTQGIVMQSHRPFLVLQEAADESLRSQLIGSGGTNVVGGAFDIFVCADISSDYVNDPRNAAVEMKNSLGQLIDGIRALHGTADYMLLNAINVQVAPSFVMRPEMSDNQARYEEWEAVIRVTWGLEG